MASRHSRLRARLQQALGKEFTVGPQVGEGGFAVVFRARDNALGRAVAVKALDLQVVPSSTLAERFLREAQTVARLEHPNIVPIHKVGGQGSVLYIIMRYIDGPSLRALLEKPKRLAVTEAVRIARDVAVALAYAHEHGIVHRDVKPDNILLDRTGHTLVTDFGIAKAAEEAKSAAVGPLTTEGMVLGTPEYMSPEQAAGEALDGRSDIYSLGVVLYHMLAGAPPFDGESAQAILAKQLTAEPIPIRERRREVSPALAAIVERMLAKEPERRYASAADVSRVLTGAVPPAAAVTEESLAPGPVPDRSTGPGVVRAGGTGCLTIAVLLGAAAVLVWTVGNTPALNVTAPVPADVVRTLRRRGALSPGDVVQYAFAPQELSRSTAIVVTKQRVTVAQPGNVRRYGREEVAYRLEFRPDRGLRAMLLLMLPEERADTVYRNLGPRAAIAVLRGLRARVRPNTEGGPGIPLGAGVRLRGP